MENEELLAENHKLQSLLARQANQPPLQLPISPRIERIETRIETQNSQILTTPRSTTELDKFLLHNRDREKKDMVELSPRAYHALAHDANRGIVESSQKV